MEEITDKEENQGVSVKSREVKFQGVANDEKLKTGQKKDLEVFTQIGQDYQ